MLRTLCALALAGVFSLSLFGGPANAQFPAQPAQPAQQFTPMNDQTMPQLLQQAGFQFQTLPGNGGTVWKVTNPQNGPAIEMSLLKNNQGQVVGLRLLISVKTPAPGSLTQADLMKLVNANATIQPYAFCVDPNLGDICLMRTLPHGDTNVQELRTYVNEIAAAVNQTAVTWNNLGQAPQQPFNPGAQQPFNPGAEKPQPFNPGASQPQQPFNPGVTPPPAPVAPGLANTTWQGTETFGGVKNLTFQLLPGGQAVMIDFQQQRPATWTQNGNQITIQVPSISTTYSGTIVGNTLSGQGSDLKNGGWSFNLTKAN